MNTAIEIHKKSDLASYAQLKERVRQTLLLGQQKIEEAKVRTYWETGRMIRQHIQKNTPDGKQRAAYNKQVVERLARDLQISERIIYQCVQFAQAIKKVNTCSLSSLTWSHFRSLSSISDEQKRNQLAVRASKSEWGARELQAEIKKINARKSGPVPANGRSKTPLELLKPRLGILYTYRLIQSKPAQSNPGRIKVDIGFNDHRTEFKMQGKIPVGRLIESRKNKDGTYTVMKSNRGEEARYFYKAWVERAVDGDTQFVEIDLGFGSAREEYLRLRGIDCPELYKDKEKKILNPPGWKSKKFVESCLRPAPYILLSSSRSDKYDRYLSDIFIPLAPDAKIRARVPQAIVQHDGSDYLYLNNALLLLGLAVRMKM